MFTKKINTLINDEEYRTLQNSLVEIPSSGKIIQGSGGIRKIRRSGIGRGKRGGIHIIYYWARSHDQIFMLYAFAKNERDDLTKDQLSMLRKALVSEFEDEK